MPSTRMDRRGREASKATAPACRHENIGTQPSEAAPRPQNSDDAPKTRCSGSLVIYSPTYSNTALWAAQYAWDALLQRLNSVAAVLSRFLEFRPLQQHPHKAALKALENEHENERGEEEREGEGEGRAAGSRERPTHAGARGATEPPQQQTNGAAEPGAKAGKRRQMTQEESLRRQEELRRQEVAEVERRERNASQGRARAKKNSKKGKRGAGKRPNKATAAAAARGEASPMALWGAPSSEGSCSRFEATEGPISSSSSMSLAEELAGLLVRGSDSDVGDEQEAALAALVGGDSCCGGRQEVVEEEEEEEEGDAREALCVICMERPSEIYFCHQGSAHLCCCSACEGGYKAEFALCPVCQQPFEATVNAGRMFTVLI